MAVILSRLPGTLTGRGVLRCDDGVVGEDDAASAKPVLASSLGDCRSPGSVIWRTGWRPWSFSGGSPLTETRHPAFSQRYVSTPKRSVCDIYSDGVCE